MTGCDIKGGVRGQLAAMFKGLRVIITILVLPVVFSIRLAHHS